MVSYQYGYLTGGLSLLVLWGILFFWRKDVRREMIYVSFLFGIIGVLADPVYFIDWYSPQTLFGIPGIESLIFGFATGGIASVIYIEVFNKRVRTKKINFDVEQNLNSLVLFLMGGIFFFGTFFILGWSSFEASFPTLLIPLAIILIKREDLIKESMISGLLVTGIAFIFFLVPEILFPGWITSSWRLENLTGILILKVPLDDLIWFFMVGAFIGPLYEYWQEGKLINIKNKK